MDQIVGNIGRKTIRENLILMKSYFNNSLSLTLDDNAARLCKIFNLQDKLDLRPGELQPVELRTAVACGILRDPFLGHSTISTKRWRTSK
ncbi:MAG: hypothetical protein ABIK98_16125 [Pseudomonadota bacterium]